MPYKSVEDNRKWQQKKRQEFRSYINAKKEQIGGCQRCGYNKYPEICDFHHEDHKGFQINRKAATRSLQSIDKELSKCVLLCKNCHAEVHLHDWFGKP